MGFVFGFSNCPTHSLRDNCVRRRRNPSVSPPRAWKPSSSPIGSYPRSSNAGMPKSSATPSTNFWVSSKVLQNGSGIFATASVAWFGAPILSTIFMNPWYVVGGLPLHFSSISSMSYSVCPLCDSHSTPARSNAPRTARSHTFAYGSISCSHVTKSTFQDLQALGNTTRGAPCKTNSELPTSRSDASKSRNDSNKNRMRLAPTREG